MNFTAPEIFGKTNLGMAVELGNGIEGLLYELEKVRVRLGSTTDQTEVRNLTAYGQRVIAVILESQQVFDKLAAQA